MNKTQYKYNYICNKTQSEIKTVVSTLTLNDAKSEEQKPQWYE